jgi:hypothetical protein
MARGQRSAGVGELGMYARVLQEPGRSRFLHLRDGGAGTALEKSPGPTPVASMGVGSERERGARVEPPSEGNEARRGDEKSEPLNSTDEAGELIPEDPVEGSRRSVYGASGGKDDTDIGP